jgi:hypothetical protein
LATTTLQAARREWARFAGYSDIVGLNGLAWSTTTNVTTATTMLVISTELRNAGFDDFGSTGAGDDSLENLWVFLLGTNNAGIERPAKSYDASEGQLVLTAGSALAAESGSTDFEIHRYRPTYIRDLMNDGARAMFPTLHVPVSRYLSTAQHQIRYDVPSDIIRGPDHIWVYKGIPVTHANNILTNGDFEDFTSGTPDSWSATTLDTAEEVETTSPFNYATIEGSSVRCTSQSGNTGTLLQTISSPGTHSGQRITLQIWVHCRTASIVSTQITINGSINLGAAADGGLHRGTGWELLTHFEDAPVTITSLTVGISVLSTATDNSEFYLDDAVSVVGPGQEPETRPVELFNWDYRENMQGTTLRQDVRFRESLPDNCLLRFEGKAYLSSLSAETDTIEIQKPQTDLLYAWMANELYEQYVAAVPDADRSFNQRRLASAARRMADLQVHAMKVPRAKIQIPDWEYSVR